MSGSTSITTLVDRPAIDNVAKPLSSAVRGAFESAGPAGRRIKNTLHGVWLGHPLHPVFTDIPVGAWTTALALDVAANDDDGMHRAATFAMGVGLAGAAGAAVTGLTDWSETDGRSRRTGLVHGLLNVAATGLFAAAFVARRGNNRAGGRGFAWAGYAVALASAYIGGDLVYGQRVGVTHADTGRPEKWVPVASSSDVVEGATLRVRKDDLDLVLVRQRGRVCALAHSCSHFGGPLSEGSLKDGSIVCPWHGSEFSLEDGRVLNGPATQEQPCFAVREQDGRIEVR